MVNGRAETRSAAVALPHSREEGTLSSSRELSVLSSWIVMLAVVFAVLGLAYFIRP